MVEHRGKQERSKQRRKLFFNRLQAGGSQPIEDLPVDSTTRIIQSRKEREHLFLEFLVIDAIVVVVRMGVAILSNSMAMYAAAVKSIVNVVTSFVSWISLKLSARQENDTYNYGLGKMESLSSIVRGSALLISFVIILFTSIGRLYLPVILEGYGAVIAIGLSFVCICGNLYRWYFVRKHIAIDARSPVLVSQYKAIKASMFVNTGSFLAVTLSVALAGYAWSGYIDPVASIILSGYLLLNAYVIMASSVNELLDRSADESIQLIIMGALVEFFDEYTQVLAIRSRKSGGTILIEIVLEFEGTRTIGDLQAVIDRMQYGLKDKITNSRITIIPRAAAPEPCAEVPQAVPVSK